MDGDRKNVSGLCASQELHDTENMKLKYLLQLKQLSKQGIKCFSILKVTPKLLQSNFQEYYVNFKLRVEKAKDIPGIYSTVL